MKRLWIMGGAALAVFLTGCASMPDYSASPNYDVEKGVFVHPDGDQNDKSIGDLLGLMRKVLTRPSDPAKKSGFPVIAPSPEAAFDAASPDANSVIWIGHSTLVFEHQGLRVMTDPIFSDRASPVSFAGPKRVVPPALGILDLPPIDVVVISHSHYDHLDLPSIRQLLVAQPDIHYVVPLGIAPLLAKVGVRNVTEIDWWQSHMVAGVKITAAPVHHWSSRAPFNRNRTQWAGFMVQFADGYKFYFAGDSGYGGDFVKTRERLGTPNFAAIPIGAYEPRNFMKSSHVNPEEAVQIFQDLEVQNAVAIHWGTFKLTLEQLAEPPVRLAAALKAAAIVPARFRALTHGERWDF